MKDDNYFVVQGWMINRLKLSGNELNVFAIIYGFSQDDASSFDGSSQYLADFCGISKVSTLGILSKLTEKGFIQKTEKYVGKLKLCSYKTTSGIETLPVKELNHSGKESLPGGKETYPVGGKETLPNNKYINNDISNNIYNVTSPKKEPVRKSNQYENSTGTSTKTVPVNQKTGTETVHTKENDNINKLSKESYADIESAYTTAFSELFPDGKCVINYGAARKRIKSLLSTLSEDDIILAIQKAKSDNWIVETMGFGLMTILSDNQIQKLLNGSNSHSSPSYSNQKYHVEQGVPRRVDPEGEKEIHV